MSYPTKDERIALCSTDVTLNGKPAGVSGYGMPFAHVTDRQTGLSAEWAWETVALVVSRGGRFQT